MKFRPLHDRVVVKRIDAEEKTTGGIIIPDTAKEKPSQGEITAVGPGGRDEAGKLISIDLKVGDRVLFGKWSGTEVKLDGQELPPPLPAPGASRVQSKACGNRTRRTLNWGRLAPSRL
jgi:chaperonin GroES